MLHSPSLFSAFATYAWKSCDNLGNSSRFTPCLCSLLCNYQKSSENYEGVPGFTPSLFSAFATLDRVVLEALKLYASLPVFVYCPLQRINARIVLHSPSLSTVRPSTLYSATKLRLSDTVTLKDSLPSFTCYSVLCNILPNLMERQIAKMLHSPS